MVKPYAIASTKGGHCLTVRTSASWTCEKASDGIERSQSGSIVRANAGRSSRSIKAGSQRKMTRIAGSYSLRAEGERRDPEREQGVLGARLRELAVFSRPGEGPGR